MGPKPIELPSFFTVTWYDQQKAKRKYDYEIADDLGISKSLLDKWKVKIGCTPKKWRGMAGRKGRGIRGNAAY